MAEIIIVEDNEAIREAVCSYLRLDGQVVREFGRVQGVLEAVKIRNPDLVILDVMLPDGDGFQLAKRIRGRSRVPILFLTARTSESDRITGFEVGGDDYVVKPFSPKELALRVQSILRRTKEKEPAETALTVWKRGEDLLVMDSLSHRVSINGKEIALTAAEWKILAYLGANPGIVVSRERILGECLDYMAEGSERTVDTHIKNIRIKLGTPELIETVRGFGYRFTGEKR
jgi:two-component system phosphate regulon response regulator PhoB